MLVHYLHNGHGAHKEEECGASLAEVALYGLAKLEARKSHTLMAQGEERPAHHAHEDGNGGLVDFCDALKSNESIANDESNANDTSQARRTDSRRINRNK